MTTQNFAEYYFPEVWGPDAPVPEINIGSKYMSYSLIPAAAYAGYKGAQWLSSKYGKGRAAYTKRRTFRRKRRTGFNRRVKNIIANTAETKYIDSNINTAAPVVGVGTVTPITIIGVGDTELLRDGDKIQFQSVQVRGTVFSDTTVDEDTGYRISLVLAKDDIKGVLPTIAEIFSENTIHSLKQRESRGRFKLLWDYRGMIKHQGAPTKISEHLFDRYYKFKKAGGRTAYYDGVAADITDLQRGHLFMVLQCNQLAADAPTFFFNIRVVFKDV